MSQNSPALEAQPNADPISKIILLVFLSVGVLLLVIAAITGVSAARTLSKEERAQGTVVDMVVRKDSQGNEFYYPVVSFVLPDGHIQLVQIPEGSWPPDYQKGEAVPLRYERDRPLNARINSTTSIIGAWLWTLITGFLGVVFLLVTLFVRWIANTSNESDLDSEPSLP